MAEMGNAVCGPFFEVSCTNLNVNKIEWIRSPDICSSIFLKKGVMFEKIFSWSKKKEEEVISQQKWMIMKKC